MNNHGLTALAVNEYFANNAPPEIQRSQFDRSAGNKLDFDAGDLIPFYADEMVPGDTFEAKLHYFARINTPIKPVMDNAYIDFHFFAVPLRILWSNFRKFMGEQANPTDSTDFLTPKLKVTGTELPLPPYTPADYMGIPTGHNNILGKINAFHFRAMNLIWNEFYRDQNLQNSRPVPLDDGPDDVNINLYHQLPRRGKRKDYFTSALPWPQKGPASTLPNLS